MGITGLQERVEVPAQIDISIQQVAQLAMNEDGQKIFEVFWQEQGELCIASWTRWEAQRKGSVDLERKRQDMSSEITNAEQKTRFFSRMRSKTSSECKTERVKDCKINRQRIKGNGKHKDRRSLANSGERA